MKTIPLTQGQVALVDDEDYDELILHKWHSKWCPSTKSYYAVRNSKKADGGEKRRIYMHREVMNAKDGESVDHIKHNTRDNQKSSLRLCSRRQNAANSGISPENTSGFKGVCWDKQMKKWRAYIKVNGKQKFLGLYSIIESAARAYDTAALRYNSEFAVTNASLGLLK